MLEDTPASSLKRYLRANRSTLLIAASVLISALFLGVAIVVKLQRKASRKEQNAEVPALTPISVKVSPQAGSASLVIGFMPSSSVEQVHQLSAAIASRMSQTENFQVRSVVGTSYGDLAEAVREGEVDAVFLSPVLYVKNDFHKTHKPLLRILRKGPNPDAYFGAFVVKSSNKRIHSMADVCNVSIGYTDLDSSSGYVYPKLMLLNYLKKTNRISKCRIREKFFNGHKGVLEAVMSGEVDVGGTFANDVKGASGSWNQIGSYPLRAIAVTERIPADGLFVRKLMDPVLQEKISHAFQSLISSADGQMMLDKLFRAQKLVPAQENDYASVVKVVSQFKILSKK